MPCISHPVITHWARARLQRIEDRVCHIRRSTDCTARHLTHVKHGALLSLCGTGNQCALLCPIDLPMCVASLCMKDRRSTKSSSCLSSACAKESALCLAATAAWMRRLRACMEHQHVHWQLTLAVQLVTSQAVHAWTNRHLVASSAEDSLARQSCS
jgi:hypothetical protein